ncbi:MAG: ABC transporter ATP-binding protein [Spirochaetaceae bacterium]|nr:MAG: ABC transporter ATP-binding protein [Spirochaetaceae bacterium]
MSQSQEAKAIEVSDIEYSYGSTKAVRGISFSVDRGEIFGFLGPNGAGKSTTIKMLTGQLIPRSGRISILGMAVHGHSAEVHQRIGVCFEEKNLYLQMSAEENLRFFASLFGIRRPDVKGLLERVNLASRSRDRVSTYSKGMRQRLMMARALINEPDVLFLDEPTDGLDPVSARAIRTIIREKAHEGTAVVLTTHDMYEADELSDRVAFITEGRIHAIDTPENLKLKHGSRSVTVRRRMRDSEVEELRLELDTDTFSRKLAEATASGTVMTIHSEEATLEDIFVEVTGRGLE